MRGRLLAAVPYAAAVTAAASGGAVAVGRGIVWYRGLRKPWFTPPDAAFGPVWTALYVQLVVSAAIVEAAPAGAARRRARALWWTQIALNAAWSPVFFGARRPRAAAAVILGLDVAAAGTAAATARVSRTAAALYAPYLLWLGLASALNVRIAQLERAA